MPAKKIARAERESKLTSPEMVETACLELAAGEQRLLAVFTEEELGAISPFVDRLEPVMARGGAREAMGDRTAERLGDALALRVGFRALTTDDDAGVRATRKGVDDFFLKHRWESGDGLSSIEPSAPVASIAHAIELLEFVSRTLQTGMAEDWTLLKKLRDQAVEPSVDEKRAFVVALVDFAIGELYPVGEIVPESITTEQIASMAEHVMERLLELPWGVSPGSFRSLESGVVARLLERASPVLPKPLGAPYIAAAISLRGGAFGDVVGPNQSEEEARRSVSKVFRSASSRELARRTGKERAG